MGIITKFKAWCARKKKTRDTIAENQRYQTWYSAHINYRAHYINDLFDKFEYIIEVDPYKFLNFRQRVWSPCDEAREYFYPVRELGDNCVWKCERVTAVNDGNNLYIDEFGGKDTVFVASNNEQDITMIALRWG